MVFYVYIIQSEQDQSFYIGQTQNLEQRLENHNLGYSLSTKHLRPWVLYASKEFAARTAAMEVERKLKNLKSKEKVINFVQKNDFTLHNN